MGIGNKVEIQKDHVDLIFVILCAGNCVAAGLSSQSFLAFHFFVWLH